MKKIIFLLMLFILTGCTANFNVKIEDEKIIQNISINADALNNDKETLIDKIEDSVVEVEHDTEYLGYFDIKNNSFNKINASRSYNLSNYYRDYALYYCYDSQNISYSNNPLKIQTSNYFNCFDKYSMYNFLC